MTVYTHVVSAVLLGSPNVALSMRQDTGRVVTSDEQAPHVEATIEVNIATAATIAALDARLSRRVRISVAESGSTVRTFDLALRKRTVQHEAATIVLNLSSDEALLGDYAPTADIDLVPQAASLRTVVNAVLAKIGASLQATPSTDANVTPYWSITNLVGNSSFEFDTAGWQNGSLADGFAPTTQTAYVGTKSGHWRTTGAGRSFVNSDRIRISPGRWYVATHRGRHLGGTNRTGGILLRWFDARGGFIRDDYSNTVTITNTSWTQASLIRQAPVGAAEASIHPWFDADGGDRYPAIDAAMLYEGNRLVPFFDGLTPDDANYSYVYSDEPQQRGTSSRVPVTDRSPDALVWKAGQTGLEFIIPLVQSAGLRLVCDETRKWTLRDETYVATGTLQVRHGVNLYDATDTIDRDSGLWFDAAITLYKWTDRDGITQEWQDVYAPTGWTRMKRFERNTPYPGPGFSEYVVRRAQGKGREVSVDSAPDWTARSEQAITAVLNGAPTQIGRTSRIEFDLGRKIMTVLTRATDTPPGSIDLLSGTIDALPRTIDTL